MLVIEEEEPISLFDFMVIFPNQDRLRIGNSQIARVKKDRKGSGDLMNAGLVYVLESG
jgi:hypothetical protein